MNELLEKLSFGSYALIVAFSLMPPGVAFVQFDGHIDSC